MIFKKLLKRAAMAVALFATLFHIGCVGYGEGGEYSFTDSTGSTVSVNKNPERVAVLFSSLADMWTLAGGEVAISVGEAVERGIVGEDTLLVDLGAGKTVNTELLISYEPDLVILSADIAAQNEAAALLRSVGIPTALFRTESFEEYLSVLKIMTEITENPDAFRLHGEEQSEKIARIKASLPEGEEKTILFVRAGSTARSTKAKSSELHFAAAMLSELGMKNIADNVPILLDGLSIEYILTEDPDYIFIVTMGDEEAAKKYMDTLFSGSSWRDLSAVKNGRYHYLPKELFHLKPNDKWAYAYSYLAEILYGQEP